jgi:hypothetical protein
MAAQSNWWDAAPLAPASDPSFAGYIPGQPKPPTPKEPKAPVFVPQGATTMFDPNTNTYTPVPKAPGQADEEKDKIKSAIEGLGVDELLSSIGRARDNLKTGWATGTWGAVAELKPGGGTPRDDFLGQLTAIQGGIINEKLAALKELSKTGASGLGALSEKEGERLASSVAALTTNMSAGEYERSFKEIARHALTLKAIRDGQDPTNPNTMKEIERGANDIAALSAPPPPAGAPRGGGTTGGGSDGSPPGIGQLTDAQQAAFAQFMRTNPNEAQVASFLQGFTNKPVTNAGDILRHYKRTGQLSGTVEDLSAQQRIRQRIDAENRLGVGADAATTLVTQGGTLNLSDEAAGVGNALAGLVTGSPDVGENYRFGRDVERQRIADARQQLGYGGTALEVISGAASAGPGRLIGPMTPAAARRAGGVAGAIGGALAGFGAGEGMEQSAAGAAGGAAVGGALGRYGPSAVERVLPRRLRPSPQMAPDVARAADAEGVDLIRPMVDPNAVSDYGALESNVYSQPIIRGAAGRVRGQIEDRAVALGQGGDPLEPEAAGTFYQRAGRRFIQRSRNVSERLYNRASSLAGDTRFEPTNAIAQVDNELAQLRANPSTNQGEIGFLEGLRSDLAAPGGKTVEELRQLRTQLRGRVVNENLTATQAEARAIRAMDATQQDVAAAVPDAASSYRRADAYYRERMTHIDDIIKRVTGGNVSGTDYQLSGEQAFNRIRGMANTDGRRLAALMRDLSPSERQDIAATFATQLGRRSPDEPFSTALFISQTRKLSPSARRTIFGPDGAQSIDNLRLLSQRLETAERDINRSRSATVLERQGWRNAARAVISGLAGMGGTAATGSFAGGAAGVAVAAGAMGASAARKVLSARAMVNPRVSRWLADTANVQTRQQAAAAVRRLGSIIAREPALAHELQPIYDSLTSRVTQPLAAQPSGQDDAGGQ